MPMPTYPPLTQDEADIEVDELAVLEDALEAGAANSAQTIVDAPSSAPGTLGTTYLISEADRLAWVPAWKLQLDWRGREYGRPVRLPRGQLDGPSGLLRARRPDGGRAFTLRQPKWIEPLPQIRCVVVQGCSYRCYTKMELIAHAENNHPTEARAYRKAFEEFREATAAGDERLRFILTQEDQPLEGMSATPGGEREVAALGEAPGSAPVLYPCETLGCNRFFDTTLGLKMHQKAERRIARRE